MPSVQVQQRPVPTEHTGDEVVHLVRRDEWPIAVCDKDISADHQAESLRNPCVVCLDLAFRTAA